MSRDVSVRYMSTSTVASLASRVSVPKLIHLKLDWMTPGYRQRRDQYRVSAAAVRQLINEKLNEVVLN